LVIVPISLFFGPLALVAGTGAGFWGGRRQRRLAPPADGQPLGRAALRGGIIAGALAGGGILLATLAFFGTLLYSLSTAPELRDQIIDQVADQFSRNGGNATAARSLFETSFLLAGLCAGTINLLVAVGTGALGGWLASLGSRRRP
jgi:hypothetical protein